MAGPFNPIAQQQAQRLQANEMWGGILAQRQQQASMLHFQLENMTPHLAALSTMEAHAAFDQMRQRSDAIGTFGVPVRRDIDAAELSYRNGTYSETGNTVLQALSARTGAQTAAVIGTGDEPAWKQLAAAAPQETWSWQDFTQQWDATHPSAPAATLAPSQPLSLTDVLSRLADSPPAPPTVDVNQLDPALIGALPYYQQNNVYTPLATGGGVLPFTSASQEAVKSALAQRGKPYVWGGENPQSGFDCSGLVQWAWRRAGVNIPRTTWSQVKVGTKVPWGGFQPGDALFFDMDGDRTPDANHVGMYVGNNKMVVAPKPGDVVKEEPLNNYWQQRFYGARRYG